MGTVEFLALKIMSELLHGQNWDQSSSQWLSLHKQETLVEQTEHCHQAQVQFKLISLL